MKYDKYKNMSALQFYALSFTWGLPMSFIGCLFFIVLWCMGHRPKKYGHCWCFELSGKHLTGFELGWLFVVRKGSRASMKKHELGHAYQNACILGLSMPIFSLISLSRFWLKKMGCKINYYGWWFESQANEIGNYIMQENENK